MTKTSSSSSNRSGGVCDAVVAKDDRITGPVRLPLAESNNFVDEFNRIYGEVGMSLKVIDGRGRA